MRVVLWLGFSNSHDEPIHMWHPSFHDILGWSARSATSRAWSSLTFEHLLLVSSAHQLGNKDHQRSWSAWQHCTNVKPSPISFRWRRESLRTKMSVQRAGYMYIVAVFCHWAKQKLIKPTMFNRTTVALAGAATVCLSVFSGQKTTYF